MNQVFLMGRLGMQPELRYTQSKQAVANVRLAVTKAKKIAGGGYSYDTHWVTVVVWGRDAESLAQCPKGSRIVVSGELQTREWTTKQGDKKSVVEVVAFKAYPLASVEAQAETASATNTPLADLSPAWANTLTEDDIPF